MKANETFEDGTVTLTFEQRTAPTPGQPEKAPQVIPMALGLISPDGDEVVPTTLIEITGERHSVSFDGLGARSVAPLLRGFSAPVILERQIPDHDRALLLAHDTHPSNKRERGRPPPKQTPQLARPHLPSKHTPPHPNTTPHLSRRLLHDNNQPHPHKTTHT